MPKLTVDGIEVDVPAGATVLQACEVAGKEIPRFCYHERLTIAGNCRMCLVEVKPGPPKPQASCALPAAEGQIVSTTSPMVKKAREGVMEFLLINHPLDCPICDQGGECDLQDQSLVYGRGQSRYAENKRAVTEKYMGPLVKTVMTRCIQCTRCVRFAEEVAGVEEIGMVFRGENEQISTYLEKALTSEVSGNIIDLCPVGALTSKPYAFAARPWEIKDTDGIDAMDALGTNISFGSRGPQVMRVLPRLNEAVNEEWAADKTRFAIDGLMAGRLDRPYVRKDGKLVAATWVEAFAAVRAGVSGLSGNQIAGIAGDLLDVESMVAFKDLLAGLGSSRIECRQDGVDLDAGNRGSYLFNSTIAGIETADVILLVGSNPRWEAPLLNTRLRKAVVKGKSRVFAIGPELDLTYPVTWLGDDLAVLAKLPKELTEGLAGAERPAIIIGTGGASAIGAAMKIAAKYELVRDGWNGWNILHTAAARVGGLDIGLTADGGVAAIMDDAKSGALKAIFLHGADEFDTASLANCFTVYIGTHGDEGVRHADVILPAAAYAEKAGTWVNMEGRVQRSLRAVSPPGDAREDWTIFRALSDVLGSTLPYNDHAALRSRMARDWPHLGTEGLQAPVWSAPAVNADKPSGKVRYVIENYYLTNPIARASATMHDCVREILGIGDLAEAAE